MLNIVAEDFLFFSVAVFVQATCSQEVPSLFRCLCLNLTDAGADVFASRQGLSLLG